MASHVRTRVLVADDAPQVSRRLTELLSEIEGVHIVGRARDGDEALALFRQLAPDLAVLDLGMPRQSGLEVLREIRQTGLTCHVIIVTNHTELALRERCLAEGADGFVHKTTELDELLALVRAHAHRPRGPRG